jgi:lipopolysaccharide transport system permease protein
VSITSDHRRASLPTGTRYEGMLDISTGVRNWPLWWLLALRHTASQYRRTYLGPWWMSMQTFIFILGLWLLFGILLHQPMREFLPYVAIGLVVFQFLSTSLIQGTYCYVHDSSVVQTAPVPLSSIPLKMAATRAIEFGHDLVVIAVLIVVLAVPLGWSMLLLPFAIAGMVLNGVAFGLWLGPLNARYRDIGPIVESFVRILFFFTPIFWVPADLGDDQRLILTAWNPFAYWVESVRECFIPTDRFWLVAGISLALTVVNCIIGVFIFSRMRPRIAYYV